MKDEPAKFKRPEASFSKAPESFRARKAITKSRTLQLQGSVFVFRQVFSRLIREIS